MVVVAICLIQYIYALIGVYAITVSTYAFKEGVLYTLPDEMKKNQIPNNKKKEDDIPALFLKL